MTPSAVLMGLGAILLVASMFPGLELKVTKLIEFRSQREIPERLVGKTHWIAASFGLGFLVAGVILY